LFLLSTAANIALNKPAFQVSTVHIEVDFVAAASAAVDGNRESNFELKSCTATEYTANAWWAVDLGAASAIIGVTITSRGDWYGKLLFYW
jgi:hypothetical protein